MKLIFAGDSSGHMCVAAIKPEGSWKELTSLEMIIASPRSEEQGQGGGECHYHQHGRRVAMPKEREGEREMKHTLAFLTPRLIPHTINFLSDKAGPM